MPRKDLGTLVLSGGSSGSIIIDIAAMRGRERIRIKRVGSIL